MAEQPRLMLFFRNRRIDATRYRKYALKDRGERLTIFLSNPKELVDVIGADNVQAALAEIERGMEELTDPNGIWERAVEL